MPSSKKRPCPTCGTLLTHERYQAVLGIARRRDREIAALRAEAQADRDRAAAELKDADKKSRIIATLKKQLSTAKADATRKAAKQQAQTVANQAAQIEHLHKALEAVRKENRHLKRGTNQATDGRVWEGLMCEFIAKEFVPLGDTVTPTERSRNGDAIWQIRDKKKNPIGRPIVIEFKSGSKVEPPHIRQTRAAKTRWECNLALLVSCGHRSGFDGVQKVGDILLVRPKSLLTMMHFIRDQHLDLARMGAAHDRDAVAKIMASLKSDDFVKPVKDTLRALQELETNLKLDAKRFGDSVATRQKKYAEVRVATEAIRENTEDILSRYSKAQADKVVPLRALRSA